MFDGPDFPKPLDEDLFDSWLEKGRSNKISYSYLLILWDEFEGEYQPVYLENRSGIDEYAIYGSEGSSETLVAAYDLYSESKLSLRNSVS